MAGAASGAAGGASPGDAASAGIHAKVASRGTRSLKRHVRLDEDGGERNHQRRHSGASAGKVGATMQAA